MPSSITSAFSEPEDFETALSAEGCLSLLITGRGQFRAQLTQVTLHRLRLSEAKENLACIAFIAVPTDTVVTAFPIGNETGLARGDIQTRSREVMILPPGEHVHIRTDGPRRWGAVGFPVDELARYGSALTGSSFVVPPVAQRWRPPPVPGVGLRSLHAAGIRMAATHPQFLVNPEAARGLEQQLIHAVVNCLALGSTDAVGRSQRRHRNIMVRFEQLLQAQPDRDIRIAETCAALDVSERLLRSLCAEFLGMGPVHYDRLRRMSLVRRLFRREDHNGTSVSEVARRHGFLDPSRFSLNYRALFGETPIATLRRGPLPHIVVERRPKKVLRDGFKSTIADGRQSRKSNRP
jgi:AraC-like DNA-binding protein